MTEKSEYVGGSSGGIVSAEDAAFNRAEDSASALANTLTSLLSHVSLHVIASMLAVRACNAASDMNSLFDFRPVLEETFQPHKKTIRVFYQPKEKR